MRRGVWPPALLGPGGGELPVPLAGRGSGKTGSDGDVGHCLEHRWAGASEALGAEFLRGRVGRRKSPGFRRARRTLAELL